MQVISKLEQSSSPSLSPINLPKDSNDLKRSFTKFLEEGQQSAHQMKRMLDQRLGLKVENDDDHHHIVVHLCGLALNSFDTCLSMLKDCDFDHQHFIKKRKFDDGTNNSECFDNCKSEETSSGIVPNKEKRGCYKRRRNGQPRVVETTNLVDDGYAWRKYGQKDILKTKYPRAYFRCTHKHDQECPATKQVQQISENPTKYMIIYHNYHTCENPLKNRSIIIDSLEESSSIFLNFETNNYSTPKKALNPSTLFPSSSVFPSNTAMVKQEHTSIKVESPLLAPHDHHCRAHNLQYSSSSDNHVPSSSDLTSTGLPSTPVSEQSDVMSPADIYSSTASPYDMYDDVLFSFIAMDYPEITHLDGLMDHLNYHTCPSSLYALNTSM